MNGGPYPHQGNNNSAQAAEESRAAYQLRLTGATYRDIAARLGLGLATVHARIETHIAEQVNPLAAELRQLELDRLDALSLKAYEVLESDHVVVQHGKIVRDEQGQPVKDHGPVLAAIDRLVRISERRSRLLGLDSPVKVDAHIERLEPGDIELHQMIAEAKQRQAAEEALLKGELPPAAEGAAEGPQGAR